MMRMEHGLRQTQSQRLMLTQRMQQALQILQYSALELQQHIVQELEANPTLEQLVPEIDSVALAPDETERNCEGEQNGDDVEFSLDGLGQHLDGAAREVAARQKEDFDVRLDVKLKEGRDLSYNPELADRRDHYTNSITQEESFAARLVNQLRLAFDDPADYAIGEKIVGDIDHRGYFTGELETIAAELNVPLARAERVLYRIQKFEPLGIGARDVVECLLIQINAEYPDSPELVMVVENHLQDLKQRRIREIAKAMKITPQRVEQLKDMLASLDPWPGLEFDGDLARYVIPDLVVEKIDGVWTVSLTEENSPKLALSRDYESLARDKALPKEQRGYIREKIESARWLIRNIEQRQQTILRIGKAIMEVQAEFLDKGVEAIRPLTLQEIADMVGVHEATVSRTTRSKYVQTPQGLFELKYFFSPGLRSDSGEDQSSKAVQLQIQKIVDAEDKKKPLSDQKIADLLLKEGTHVARRTVTKYREALQIASTTKRKQY